MNSLATSVLNTLLSLWVQIRDLYLYLFRHAIVVNGYVDDHTWRGIRHRNWGDDLNYYFLQELTERPIVFYHHFKFAKWLRLKNYLCIGTLLDAVNYSNRQTVVWGSGVSGQEREFVCPEKILAVRGKKTKEFLDRHHIPCPEVYGDPALLLPLVYQPCMAVKKYKLGIIPHVVDLRYPVVEEIRKKHSDEILIVDLAHYEKWTDVIDQICSCERILSSSLHGLIVSDTYQVPNCWIELTGNIAGGYFKFHDYFSSVSKNVSSPLTIVDIKDILSIRNDSFNRADINIISNLRENLQNVVPFKTQE